MSYLLIATLFLIPTYVIRFTILGVPLNVLMVWVFFLELFFFATLVKSNRLVEFWLSLKNNNKFFLIFFSAFLLSGTLALFIGGFSKDKLGQYIVLFLEPMSLYFIVRFLYKHTINAKEVFLRAVIMFVGLCGLYAILQYFTLFGLPHLYMGNSIEPKRALSFFEYPNAYALFIAPLLAFAFPKIMGLLEDFNFENIKYRLYPILAWSVGLVGLILSLSRGGWLGFGFSAAVGVLLLGSKKVKKFAGIAIIIIIVVSFSVPVIKYRLILPFLGEKSAVSRVSLASTAVLMIEDSPVLGKGLLGYDTNFEKYNTDPGLQHYKYPHNFFLTLWVEVGVLGLLSFIGILMFGLFLSYKRRDTIFTAGVFLFLLALVLHGVVDVPYFKNDLALLFWIVFAIL